MKRKVVTLGLLVKWQVFKKLWRNAGCMIAILASKAQNLPGLINGEGGWEFTLERLDRAVANTEWCTLFDVVDVYVLARHCSDHNPLYVVFKNSNDFQWSRRRQFRFEVSWSTHKDHRSLIKQEWRAKAPVENKWSNVIQKLQSCRKALQKWVRKVANPVDGQIKEKMQALQVLQQRADSNCVEDEAVLSSDINAPLEQEEMKWKQRAKENWLQLGDRNTKFFHASATQRSNRNTIAQIKDKDGRLCRTQAEVEGAFIAYFEDPFKAGEALEVDACIQHVERKVTPGMNQRLLAEFTFEDISSALNQMAPLKALAQMGFQPASPSRIVPLCIMR